MCFNNSLPQLFTMLTKTCNIELKILYRCAYVLFSISHGHLVNQQTECSL